MTAHTVASAWVCGAFMMAAISASYFLRGRGTDVLRASLKLGCRRGTRLDGARLRDGRPPRAPGVVPSLGDPSHALRIRNASSTALTLKVMLTIALLGMQLVVAYTVYIYRNFAGPVVRYNGGG